MADKERELTKKAADEVATTDGDVEFPEEVSQIMESMPETERHVMTKFFYRATSMVRVSPEMEVSKKLSPEHITKMLENESTAMRYQHEDEQQSRRHHLIYVIIAVILIMFLVLTLKDNPDVLEKILYAAGGMVAGAAGGYGYAQSRKE